MKSLSGSASANTPWRMLLKLSVVEISTCMRAGRSARAQTTPESVPTSPDCSPWVMIGRSAARLKYGLAIPPAIVIAAVETEAPMKRRRVRTMRSLAMGCSLDHRRL